MNRYVCALHCFETVSECQSHLLISVAAACLPAANAPCLVLRLAADITPSYHMRASLTLLILFAGRMGLSRLVFTFTGRVGQAQSRLFSSRAAAKFLLCTNNRTHTFFSRVVSRASFLARRLQDSARFD
jgi:hypothetical protein